MLYAVLSDVHSNIEALHAVLGDVGQRKIKNVLFIGDSVGYGPDPNECLELLSRKCKTILAGNHDWGVLGITDIAYFNEYAREAIRWTTDVITKESKSILKSFCLTKEIGKSKILLVHSTPKEPEAWHYLLTLWDAEINFHYFDGTFCFLGHTHQPFIIERLPSGELLTYKKSVRIGKSARYIINAGSVGQPRDGDPRACYAIIDDDHIEIVRVPYDIETVQNKMRTANLPSPLIERLSWGR
jgi:predicted phosphodiesterase